MDTGWIKIHRSILKWEWIDTPNTLLVFIHLLLTVNWEDGRWRGIEVKKGQRVTSLSKLAQECGLSLRSLRTSLNHLKATHEITHDGHKNFSLITVTKFNEYQSIDTQSDTRPTYSRHTTDNNIRKKEYKNNKKEEESGENSPPKPSPSEIFLQFVSDVRTKSEKYEKLVYELNLRTRLEDSKVRAELDKFVNYWTEKNQTGKKERWQMQPTFETQKRLTTWFSNITKYQEKSSKGAFIS